LKITKLNFFATMKKTFATLAVILTVTVSSAFAQTTFTGTYTWGSLGNTNSFAYNGTDIPNLTEGNFLKVGVTSGSSSGNFRASAWALDATSGSLTGSVDLGKYFEFSLTAAAGFTFDMTSFTFGVGRSGTGPRSFQWRSSLDTYGSVISGYTTVNTNLSQSLGAGILSYTSDVTTAATGNVLNLSNATYQGLTNITFRFYAFNAETNSGTGGLEGNFTFAGSLLNTNPVSGGRYWSAVPGGGGSGTWTSAGTTWATNTGGAGAGQIQSDQTLIFTNAAGTVTVSGGVTVSNGMTFQTTGYDVQGSTITLAGTSAANNAITTDEGVTTTISSELAGTTGMAKAGAGTLVLSGANTFAGNVTVNGGTMQIASDSALGNTANDLVNNGTLKTTGTVSLGAGRDITGSGTFDIAGGTTLTVNGGLSNTATTLNNTGTLDLQGSTRSLGALALSAAGTITASGAISNVTSLSGTGLSSGTAVINPDVIFTSGTKTVNVSSGGNLALNGAVSGATVIAKTGSGTLSINGANTAQVRVGASGASPTAGGTVLLGSAASAGSGQIQLNYGTLMGASSLVITNTLSIGGQTNGAALLAGNNLEFQGQSSFFKGSGTTGPSVLVVSNTTTFSGGFGASGGSGTGVGITLGGNGTVIISGNSSALVDSITLTDTVKLTLNNTIGGGLTVGASNILGGNGTIGGNLSLLSGAKIQLSTLNTITVNGSSVTFGGFAVSDLIGLNSSTPNGVYTILGGVAVVNSNNLLNLGAANSFDLGGGKSAYFTINSLELNVVPEPSTYALLALSALGLAGHVVHRRRR
jgi:autotransporter-associated beta strand protein